VSFRHHLVRWEAAYAEDGLVILEISGGKFASFEYSQKALGCHACHPVVWDAENRNHGAYGVRGWPTAYLIGADGKVFWEGNPAWVHARPQELREFTRILETQLQVAKKLKNQRPNEK
jgi:hypothetical protein